MSDSSKIDLTQSMITRATDTYFEGIIVGISLELLRRDKKISPLYLKTLLMDTVDHDRMDIISTDVLVQLLVRAIPCTYIDHKGALRVTKKRKGAKDEYNR